MAPLTLSEAARRVFAFSFATDCMAASRQKMLQEAWLGGRVGNLTAMEEARAWALREAWQDEGKSSYGMLAHVASKVYKIAPKGPKRAKRVPRGNKSAYW